MPTQKISYAQNGEDIVLWRAFGHLASGRYVDIGANDPTTDSISRIFYDQGWSGITVEPMPELAAAHRAERPRDTMVEAVITAAAADDEKTTLHSFGGTGLSTLVDDIAEGHEDSGFERTEISVAATTLQQIVDEHLAGQEVQFCCIDVEGAEADVLRSVDLATFRPWAFVIEATMPRSTEQVYEEWEPMLLRAGYQFCLFDGLSRFYVLRERADEFGAALSVPASVLDDFEKLAVVRLHEQLALSRNHGLVMDQRLAETEREAAALLEERTSELHARTEELTARTVELEDDRDALREQLLYWRKRVLSHWAHAAANSVNNHVSSDASRELDAMRHTVSWRVTAPLRAVRRRMPGRA